MKSVRRCVQLPSDNDTRRSLRICCFHCRVGRVCEDGDHPGIRRRRCRVVNRGWQNIQACQRVNRIRVGRRGIIRAFSRTAAVQTRDVIRHFHFNMGEPEAWRRKWIRRRRLFRLIWVPRRGAPGNLYTVHTDFVTGGVRRDKDPSYVTVLARPASPFLHDVTYLASPSWPRE